MNFADRFVRSEKFRKWRLKHENFQFIDIIVGIFVCSFHPVRFFRVVRNASRRVSSLKKEWNELYKDNSEIMARMNEYLEIAEDRIVTSEVEKVFPWYFID